MMKRFGEKLSELRPISKVFPSCDLEFECARLEYRKDAWYQFCVSKRCRPGNSRRTEESLSNASTMAVTGSSDARLLYSFLSLPPLSRSLSFSQTPPTTLRVDRFTLSRRIRNIRPFHDACRAGASSTYWILFIAHVLSFS